TMVFNEDIKIFPARNTYRVLENKRGRVNKYLFDYPHVNPCIFKQGKRGVEFFYLDDHIDHHQTHPFSDDGCIGGTIETKLRHTKLTIDKSIVEDDIGNRFT